MSVGFEFIFVDTLWAMGDGNVLCLYTPGKVAMVHG